MASGIQPIGSPPKKITSSDSTLDPSVIERPLLAIRTFTPDRLAAPLLSPCSSCFTFREAKKDQPSPHASARVVASSQRRVIRSSLPRAKQPSSTVHSITSDTNCARYACSPEQRPTMTSVNPAVVALDDTHHPNAHLTTRNANVSPFLKFPLEIRLLVYKYAVFVQKPIKPLQVKRRSNKFVWGNHSTQDVSRDHAPPQSVRVSTEEPLAMTQLSFTCRQIYKDLEAYPVFYRVNAFSFTEEWDAATFVVAITPERRSMIRRIIVYSEVNLYGGLGRTLEET
ncbi:Uu.00g042610.m01.CDS01 [Anthostomella pinea]|uniref:Uu.00g042610.m01.CDS01 n=1 Tax=Anthostomella pinea TaxID=933095 RepID=A0AAI8YE98_9PEZI|nr:Uu.00g042610.m01.CDS01 [Anthostomella pinea]